MSELTTLRIMAADDLAAAVERVLRNPTEETIENVVAPWVHYVTVAHVDDTQ